ncbi:MAG: efflux transporter periplasmic adaptor subunit [Henriciella sp.]|nr:efflux transporter periplasmic adaptor subunit [Henriciella sp.]QYJ00602.1 efflux RND transporter periplasmic adaptor subunit [Thalassovita mediterranea]|tara:strand:+ start:468 stop:1697 length:1230 start_codon:yes stop_codon:yes gene_type:complete
MKKNLFYAAILSPAFLYLAACGNGAPASSDANQTALETDDEHEEADGEHAGHEEDGDHVELSAEAAEAVGIHTAQAETGTVSGLLELPAEIRFDADRVARVSPQVEGIVAELYAGEGDTVKAGTTLARLTSRELAGLKADYLNALSAERLAQAELAREENLWKQKITSEADVQSARASFSAANAAREAAESRLHAVGIGHSVLDGLDEAADGALAQAYLTAPITGEIIERRISLGETVSAGGEPMFVIIDDSVVWADIAVYKEDLGKVEEGQTVVLQREDGQRLAEGKISTVLPVIAETSRTATARVIVDNAEHRLKPGQFVTARIETGEARSVVRVPSDALVSVEDRISVFVPTDDGFQPREVRTGDSAGGYTEIVSGLEAGEAFVIEGAFTLKAQLEKDAFGDGHAH